MPRWHLQTSQPGDALLVRSQTLNIPKKDYLNGSEKPLIFTLMKDNRIFFRICLRYLGHHDFIFLVNHKPSWAQPGS